MRFESGSKCSEIDSKTVANDLVSKASKQIIDKQINETQGEILDNDYVANEKIASLMDLAKTQTEDSHQDSLIAC